jgi:hypothetical protein
VSITHFPFISLQKLNQINNNLNHKNIMKLTLQQVSVALDVIYRNACRPGDLQQTKSQLVKEAGVGLPTFNKLIQALISRQLLFVYGATRNQINEWNKERTAMNHKLAKAIYEELYNNEVVKPRYRKAVKLQYDEIVEYLRSRGWRGTLERTKEDGLIIKVEQINI